MDSKHIHSVTKTKEITSTMQGEKNVKFEQKVEMEIKNENAVSDPASISTEMLETTQDALSVSRPPFRNKLLKNNWAINPVQLVMTSTGLMVQIPRSKIQSLESATQELSLEEQTKLQDKRK